MSRDVQSSPGRIPWGLRSKQSENKENKPIGASEKRGAFSSKLEVDENIRKKYEPTGSIPKRFGNPSTSGEGPEKLKIPQSRQGDAGVFTKSKFFVFDEEKPEKVSKIDKKPISDAKRLNRKFMGNSSVLEEGGALTTTQAAFSKAKDFFEKRDSLGKKESLGESPDEEEKGFRRLMKTQSLGEGNRKLLKEIQNLGFSGDQGVVGGDKNKEDLPEISAEKKKDLSVVSEDKDGVEIIKEKKDEDGVEIIKEKKDEDGVEIIKEKKVRAFRRLYTQYSVEDVARTSPVEVRGLVPLRVDQLLLQLHTTESKETPHVVPAPSPEKIKILHKSLQEQELKIQRNVPDREPLDTTYDSDYMPVQEEKDAFRTFTPNWRVQNASADQRQTVVTFVLRIGIHNALPSHLIYTTVRIFDDVLQAMKIPLEKLQLMMIASLWIAMKKDWIIYRIPGSKRMAEFANGQYTAADVRSAELKIMGALKFTLTYPTPFSTLVFLMRSLNHADFMTPQEEETIYYFGGYMIDLALLDEELMKASPILLAATAAELATTLAMEPEDTLFCTFFQRWRSPYASEHLKDEDITHLRALLIRNITESCYKQSKSHIIHKKYLKSRYGKVAKKLMDKIQKLVPPNL